MSRHLRPKSFGGLWSKCVRVAPTQGGKGACAQCCTQNDKNSVCSLQTGFFVLETATLDAQVARQTPCYNPRQRTAQETDLIRRLEAKGGRVVDPYHTTPATTPTRPSFMQPKKAAADRSGGMFASPSAATSSTGAGPLAPRMAQQEGKLRNGKTDPLGFGSSYQTTKKQW